MLNSRGNIEYKSNPKVAWKDVIGMCAHYWAKEKPRWVVFVCLVLGMVGLDLALPVMSGVLVDRATIAISGEIGFDTVYSAAAVILFITALFHLLRLFRLNVIHAIISRGMEDVLNDSFSKVQKFSTDWHANTFAGATVRKLTRAKWAYDGITAVLWHNFMPIFITIVGLIIMITVKYTFLGAVFAAFTLVYFLAAIFLANKYVLPANIAAATCDSKLGGALADTISNNPTVKVFGAERREDQRFTEQSGEWKVLCQRSWDRAALMFFIQKMIWVAMYAMLLLSFVYLAQIEQATTGDIAFILMATGLIAGQLRAMGDLIRMLQRSFSDIEDVVHIFKQNLQVADTDGAVEFVAEHGEIEFENVRFQYSESAAPIYNGFSLKITAGESIGLVGPSGSGKSTFVKLIQRLYDINEGEIRIDGQPINLVRQDSLRRAISIVPQEPHLFHRSLAENIAYAKPDASMDEIIDAAQKARAHEFIEKLPLGYETLVGERGVKLSGGERQRVAIARAFLADSPIIIFDEATSSLDMITEKKIKDAMDELMKGRTTILIAHRLSTVTSVDRILVFKDGAIVEQGRHASLISKSSGHYKALHESQLVAV